MKSVKNVALTELRLNGSMENRGQRTSMVKVCFLFCFFNFGSNRKSRGIFFSVSFTFSSKFPYVLPSFFFLSSPSPFVSLPHFSHFHSCSKDNSTVSSVVDGLGDVNTVGM